MQYTIIGINSRSQARCVSHVEANDSMQVEENFQFNNPDIIIAGVLLGHLVTEDELETQDMSNGRCYA